MKRFWITAILVLLLPSGVFADEYSIDRVEIQARVNPEGSIHLLETRTYTFTGDFHWANYTLQKAGFTELTDISIRDSLGKYTHESSEESRTFRLTTNEEELNLQWYFEATNETRSFILEYTIHGALAVGHSWTEWFWRFIGNGWDEPSEEILIDVRLPGKVSPDSLYGWVHTSADHSAMEVTPGKISIQAAGLPEENPLTLRLLFPSRWLSGVPVNATELTLSGAQAEEQQRKARLEARRERRQAWERAGLPLAVGLTLLSLISFLWLYNRHGRRHSIRNVPEHQHRLPTEHPPALIGWLMQNYTVNGRNLVATIFDLARRGYFTFREEKEEKSGFLRKSSRQFLIQMTEKMPETGRLTEWEQGLYDLISQRMTDGEVSFAELTDQRAESPEWFKNWASMVSDTAKSKNWRDERSIRGAVINAVIQAVLFAAAIALVILSGAIGFIPLVITLCTGIASLGIVRRTREGERVYRQWKALKQSLKEGVPGRRDPDLLNEFYIYAIAMGLSVRKIRNWLENIQIQSASIPWIVFAPGIADQSGEVAASLSTLTNTGIQTISSVAGGTGATAGSAGGGTGGGAG